MTQSGGRTRKSRSVSKLTRAQLERKRAQDRKSKRAKQQKTEKQIEDLKKKIAELQSSLERVLQRTKESSLAIPAPSVGHHLSVHDTTTNVHEEECLANSLTTPCMHNFNEAQEFHDHYAVDLEIWNKDTQAPCYHLSVPYPQHNEMQPESSMYRQNTSLSAPAPPSATTSSTASTLFGSMQPPTPLVEQRDSSTGQIFSPYVMHPSSTGTNIKGDLNDLSSTATPEELKQVIGTLCNLPAKDREVMHSTIDIIQHSSELSSSSQSALHPLTFQQDLVSYPQESVESSFQFEQLYSSTTYRDGPKQSPISSYPTPQRSI